MSTKVIAKNLNYTYALNASENFENICPATLDILQIFIQKPPTSSA